MIGGRKKNREALENGSAFAFSFFVTFHLLRHVTFLAKGFPLSAPSVSSNGTDEASEQQSPIEIYPQTASRLDLALESPNAAPLTEWSEKVR
jgi:hypothetical protein